MLLVVTVDIPVGCESLVLMIRMMYNAKRWLMEGRLDQARRDSPKDTKPFDNKRDCRLYTKMICFYMGYSITT